MKDQKTRNIIAIGVVFTFLLLIVITASSRLLWGEPINADLFEKLDNYLALVTLIFGYYFGVSSAKKEE